MYLENQSDHGIWISIAIALVCGFASSIGFGILAPLFTMRMDDLKISNAEIGVMVTIVGLAPLVFTPFVPNFMARVAVKPALAIAISLVITLYALLTQFDGPLMWTFLRFLFAILLTFLFVASESWILELAPEKYRGRVLGLYATIFSGGFGLGGVLISIFGYQSNATIYVAIAINILVLPLLLMVKSQSATKPHASQIGYKKIIANIFLTPFLFIPALAMGGIETAAFNFFPIWVRKTGLHDNMSGFLISAAAFGNLLLQGPIGILADKKGRKTAMIFIAIVAFLGPFALMLTHNSSAILLIVAIWSGCVTGYYTMGLMGLAQHYGSGQLSVANASFGTMYCLGQFVAPLIGGVLLQVLGANAFMLGLAITGILPILFLVSGKNTAKSALVS